MEMTNRQVALMAATAAQAQTTVTTEYTLRVADKFLAWLAVEDDEDYGPPQDGPR